MAKGTCYLTVLVQNLHEGGRREPIPESHFLTSVYIILVTEFDNLVRDKAKKVFSSTRNFFSPYSSFFSPIIMEIRTWVPTGCASS